MDVGPGASRHDLRLRVTPLRRVGRWFRNHGFVFTEWQVFSRWDDIGGPTRFETWTMSSRWRYAVVRAGIQGASGAFGVVLGGLLLGSERSEIVEFATIMGVAGGLVMFLFASLATRQWKRQRDMYDRWLQRRAYLDAKARAQAVAI